MKSLIPIATVLLFSCHPALAQEPEGPTAKDTQYDKIVWNAPYEL